MLHVASSHFVNTSTQTHKHVCSMYPLLSKDGLSLQYFACQVFFFGMTYTYSTSSRLIEEGSPVHASGADHTSEIGQAERYKEVEVSRGVRTRSRLKREGDTERGKGAGTERNGIDMSRVPGEESGSEDSCSGREETMRKGNGDWVQGWSDWEEDEIGILYRNNARVHACFKVIVTLYPAL